MSNALAIAGVTAVLKDLLDSGLIEHEVTDAMGQGVAVSAVAPDTIELTGPNAKPRLNLFLHQVTPNPSWRNHDLPSHDSRGTRVSNPPLALDLHYLMTAYGTEDLQAEVLLGYAMQLLHETPVLARQAIRTALNPSPVNGGILPTIYKALRASDLAEQVEQIKITPGTMNSEEMSRLWSALQAHYRPTAVYHVSVVLIESRRPARMPLPVLTRGPLIDPATGRDRGVVVEPSLIPPIPAIEAVSPPAGQPSARLEDTVDVSGHHLDGSDRRVHLVNTLFNIAEEVPALQTGGANLLQFVVPDMSAGLPAGVYLLSCSLTRPGETMARTTNRLALAIAPEITTSLPIIVQRDQNGMAEIVLNCRPEVRPGQKVSLALGTREVLAEPFDNPTGTLTFNVPDAPIGQHLARLRVDGVESLVIDRTATPPTFFDDRIEVQ
jgi:hypothetical protein